MGRSWTRRLPGRRCGTAGSGEAGFASVLALALTLVLSLAALGVGLLGSALEAKHRAAATADLAAVAAAHAVQRYEDGCLAAALIAARNGGSLEHCGIEGGQVSVAVRIDSVPLLGLRAVTGVVQTARAGPAAGF